MSTKNVTLKEKVNGVLGDTIFPATTTPNVYDSAKSQVLSQTLVDTPDYEALGFVKFSTATAYNTGDKVYKDNELYRFIADKTAGEWDVAKVEPWSIEQEIKEVDDAIRSLIPAQASADNKLADKAYVNDKVSTDTATFRGTFNLVTDLQLTTEATQGQIATALGTAISGEDKNDYAFVQIPTSDATPTEIARIDRYKYTGLQWAFEYSLNNSGFTAEQWAAINSGITSSLVTAFGAKYDKPAGGIPVSDMNTSTFDDEPTENSVKPAKSGGIWSWVTGLINGIREWASGTFAKVDGWYKTLVAGAAENLVGYGTTPAEYTFRTSGGTADIGTGTATIDIVKGKTLVWNQLATSIEYTNKYVYDATAHTIQIIDITQTDFNTNAAKICDVVNGHKYYISVKYGGTGNIKILNYYGGGTIIESANMSVIYTAANSYNIVLGYSSVEEAGTYDLYLKVTDLTQMFGAGNEPSTVAEFEALYPLDYYDYTATPVLINNAAKGIVTTGFNQWDEEWEVGGLNPNTGMPISANNEITSKNFIPAFPSTDYYFNLPTNIAMIVCCYNKNKNYIGRIAYGGISGIKTTMPETAYIKFCTYSSSYGTTYKNDICINLSWSGYRNGEYEPYEKHTLYFNGENGSLATVTGKKLVSGVPTGESVTIFPDGMKSAGSVYDFGKADSDGYIRKVTKRIGSVDLGSLSWNATGTRVSGKVRFLSSDTNLMKSSTYNSICSTYVVVASTYEANETGYAVDTKKIAVYDEKYAQSDAATFEAAMNGVILYYELETPEEYLLDTPIPARYIVNDFGTEQRIPEDTASSVMAPILYDVKYAMNAVDTLRRLPVNYISKASFDNFCTEMASKLGTALSATVTITPSWDSENQEYDFSITITPNE